MRMAVGPDTAKLLLKLGVKSVNRLADTFAFVVVPPGTRSSNVPPTTELSIPTALASEINALPTPPVFAAMV